MADDIVAMLRGAKAIPADGLCAHAADVIERLSDEVTRLQGELMAATNLDAEALRAELDARSAAHKRLADQFADLHAETYNLREKCRRYKAHLKGLTLVHRFVKLEHKRMSRAMASAWDEYHRQKKLNPATLQFALAHAISQTEWMKERVAQTEVKS